MTYDDAVLRTFFRRTIKKGFKSILSKSRGMTGRTRIKILPTKKAKIIKWINKIVKQNRHLNTQTCIKPKSALGQQTETETEIKPEKQNSIQTEISIETETCKLN